MNINAPLWQWSVTALAQAILEKQVSSREVVRAHLERIAKVNGKVKALTVILEESALAEARAADERLAAGHEVGPLHGVPVTIKDNIDLMGSATTQGIVALKNSMPRTDAPVVAYEKFVCYLLPMIPSVRLMLSESFSHRIPSPNLAKINLEHFD